MAKLTLEQAGAIVDGALAHGRDHEFAPLAVAVLDDGGHLKAFAREDRAGFLRPDIAIGKAWGALGMGVGTRALAARAAQGGAHTAFFGSLGAMSGGRVVAAPGGVLIRTADGELLGAVGISGDLSEKDEACALAGIESAGLVGDPGA